MNRILGAVALLALVACGSKDETPAPRQQATTAPTPVAAPPAVDPTVVPAELPNALLIGYSPFTANDQGQWVVPSAARFEIVSRTGGEWRTDAVVDPDSNVFHKVMPLTLPGGETAILTAGGMGAYVKLWRRQNGAYVAQTIWHESFGGRFDRMRDVETADLFGDGRPALAIATHDQGVIAFARLAEDGTWSITQTPKRPDIFVHEIEIGDLDGNGVPEVYATPSEPNHTRGGAQAGEVVRIVPRESLASTVVARLGDRHAKEIWVGDADGDGRDELYVAVEGMTERQGDEMRVTAPVEIRRYDHDTAADGGVVIGRIENDHLTRFLTVGDVDGDGKREMVVASFSQGLWLLRPGANPRAEWTKESIDRDSGGFEHSSYFADLDGNGSSELYVASDNDGELRRYVWVNGRARRTMVTMREQARSMITWNITSIPASVVR